MNKATQTAPNTNMWGSCLRWHLTEEIACQSGQFVAIGYFRFRQNLIVARYATVPFALCLAAVYAITQGIFLLPYC